MVALNSSGHDPFQRILARFAGERRDGYPSPPHATAAPTNKSHLSTRSASRGPQNNTCRVLFHGNEKAPRGVSFFLYTPQRILSKSLIRGYPLTTGGGRRRDFCDTGFVDNIHHVVHVFVCKRRLLRKSALEPAFTTIPAHGVLREAPTSRDLPCLCARHTPAHAVACRTKLWGKRRLPPKSMYDGSHGSRNKNNLPGNARVAPSVHQNFFLRAANVVRFNLGDVMRHIIND